MLQREYIKYVETKVNESHPHNERGILITDIYLSIISKVKEGSAIVLADTTPDFFNSGSTWSHPPSDFEEFKLPLYVIEKRMDEIEKVVNNGDFVAIVKSDVSSYTYYWLVPLNNFKSI